MLSLSVMNFKARSYLLIEGKANSGAFFLIKSGKVKGYREHDTEGTGFKDLGPGDFAGLVSCMADVNQIESCLALTDVSAICIKREQYEELIKENPSIAFKIIKLFSRRMRAMNETLTKLSYSSVAKDSTEHIFEVAQYYDEAGAVDVAFFAYYQYLAKCNNRTFGSGSPNTRYIPIARSRYKLLCANTKAVHLKHTDDEMCYYPEGTMVFSESQDGTQMYIIIEGQVKITKIVDGQEVILAILKVGDVFGEMALLDNLPRSANAITMEDTLLMVVRQDNYKAMVNMQLKIINSITRSFSKRIYLMYRKFDNVNLIDPANKLIDMLAICIEEQVGAVQSGLPYQTDITMEELANMCGIPGPMQEFAISQLRKNERVQIMNDKIFVPDTKELVSYADFVHKQNDRLQRQLRN